MKPIALIVSEHESSNLGDQAIARSLESLLSRRFDVRFLSFGGRCRSSSQVALSFYKRKLSFFRWLAKIFSPKIKARIRWYILGGRRGFRNYCMSPIRESSIVIVGGGQLVKNNVALFCDRLSVIDGVARDFNVSVALVGVGVDQKMNVLTWGLARGLIKNSEFIMARDDISRRRILRNSDYSGRCLTLPDAAFALDNPGFSASKQRSRLSAGINIMSGSALLYGKSADACFSQLNISRRYCQIVKDMYEEGISCVIFTSGSPEDLVEAENVKKIIFNEAGFDVPVFHPQSLDELLAFLSTVYHVVAARMHVGILSYISGCNPVCINWDDKVYGVWSAVGQENRVVELDYFLKNESKDNFIKKIHSLKAPSFQDVCDLRTKVRLEIIKEFDRALAKANNSSVAIR
ncbi:polysaccharide pyruvyl transferase family protein [Alloalcanivorax sp. C16-1]|uniref:polysaccharide pyruvyl transferase family protein n=1 Tax=Alloalcanivorax sp. C16-1 TaxID=3390051 RepID=UPI0039706B1B